VTTQYIIVIFIYLFIIIIQDSHTSWKVIEFKKEIFQAWKVMENDCDHEKSWNFLTEG